MFYLEIWFLEGNWRGWGGGGGGGGGRECVKKRRGRGREIEHLDVELSN